jgi:AraC family transcriptional regulator of adaptative response / methylphosphotriester-DNA alkyltransferase methyltransferase
MESPSADIVLLILYHITGERAFVFLLFHSEKLTFRGGPGYTVAVEVVRMAEVLTDTMWQAIVTCDSSHDGTFFYGVSTTGIFCRPSCKSRTPAKENIRVFRDARQALTQQYRPCKRCRPDGIRLQGEEWADQIAGWLREHYAEPVTLDRLADAFHAGASHLQRTFKRLQGISPAVYLQQIRLIKAQEMLESYDLTISEIAGRIGFANAAHFSTLFVMKKGISPSQYRDRHAFDSDEREAGSR